MAGPRLIDLQTDLKSLRYGSDKPYVTKDINNPPSSNQTGMQITKRVDDLTRIGKMLIDRPGLKFLGNQALLQQVNIQDKIQKSKDKGKTTVGAILQQGLATVKQTAKILGSTIAQVPVNGTGTHFVYAFRTDTYLQPAGGNQRSAFAQFFGAGGIEGAQYALRGENVPGVLENSNFYDPKTDTLADTPDSPEIKSLNLSQTSNSYLPPASDGDIDNAILATELGNEDALGNLSRTYLEQQNQKLPTEKRVLGSIRGEKLSEVSGSYRGPEGYVEEAATEYFLEGNYTEELKVRGTKNGGVVKEQRVLLGDQGARNADTNYQTGKSKNRYWFKSDNGLEVDKINAQFPSVGKVDGETEGRDLIKFRFHILTADGVETVLYFRAFLDAFSDNYTGQWSPVKYLGRAEDFQIYSGFQRKITLSFKIAAATRSEMEPLYQKMIWLASATAPTYASGGQFMRGTITKITVGDYIYELPGVLNSVGYTWNPDYPWEIAMLEPEATGEDNFEQELPMVLDCQIDFTPIHTFTPTTGLRNYITTSKPTEKPGRGITNIDNQKTGIEPVPDIPATQAAAPPAPATPYPSLLNNFETTPVFGPQNA